MVNETQAQNNHDNPRHVNNIGLPAGKVLSETKAVVDTTTLVTFVFDPPIHSAVIEITPTAGNTAPEADEGIVITFGADNDGVANGFLNPANIAPRESFKIGDGPQGRYFDGALISRADVKGVGTTPLLDVTIGGIS